MAKTFLEIALETLTEGGADGLIVTDLPPAVEQLEFPMPEDPPLIDAETEELRQSLEHSPGLGRQESAIEKSA